MKTQSISKSKRRRAWTELMGDAQCLYCPHHADRHTGVWGGWVHMLALLMPQIKPRLDQLKCTACGSVCWRRAGVEIEEGA